jgi:hypothetical protein
MIFARRASDTTDSASANIAIPVAASLPGWGRSPAYRDDIGT